MNAIQRLESIIAKSLETMPKHEVAHKIHTQLLGMVFDGNDVPDDFWEWCDFIIEQKSSHWEKLRKKQNVN